MQNYKWKKKCIFATLFFNSNISEVWSICRFPKKKKNVNKSNNIQIKQRIWTTGNYNYICFGGNKVVLFINTDYLLYKMYMIWLPESLSQHEKMVNSWTYKHTKSCLYGKQMNVQTLKAVYKGPDDLHLQGWWMSWQAVFRNFQCIAVQKYVSTNINSDTLSVWFCEKICYC